MEVDPRVRRSRAAVLAAGVEVLASEGWEAITHLRLAEVSGVGRATLYRHWPTTEDLLEDVLRSVIDARHTVEPVGELRADLVDQLRLLATELEEPSIRGVLLTLMQRAESAPRFSAILEHVTAKGQQALEAVLSDGGGNAEDATALLIGPLLHRSLFRRQRIDDAFVELVVDAFLGDAT